MSDLLLELYSEEIPPTLQEDAKNNIAANFISFFEKHNFKKVISETYSTPKRLIFYYSNLPINIKTEAKILRGPKVGAPEQAIQGFVKSNNLDPKDIYEEEIDKGKFIFAKTQKKEIPVIEEIKKNIPNFLNGLQWRKKMRWGGYDLSWGRPLKSILCLFDKNTIPFNFFHLTARNITYVDGPLEDKAVVVKDYSHFKKILADKRIIFDNAEREKLITKNIISFLKKNDCELEINNKLLKQVVNLVEDPIVLKGSFLKDFLKLPEELLILTMQHHQRYFPMRSINNHKLINNFIVVANKEDIQKKIIKGNERVLAARLTDAKFFWEKNKSQNLVKQVSKLKGIIFYKGLGSLYDKTQRIRVLASFIADIVNCKKDDAEIAASICKADLVSDLVGEYPELQGVLGKYFAVEQGFSLEIANAISDHYLPIGPEDKVPKEKISIAIALADKIDNLVGFFGINEKPTSSKDPYALRRSALFFITERFKNLLKDNKIRADVIESVLFNNRSDDYFSLFNKIKNLNKVVKTDDGVNAIAVYKRCANILEQSKKDLKQELFGDPDTVLFKHNEENFLLEKINEIREHYTTPARLRTVEQTMGLLAGTKSFVDKFFDNVKVNDENEQIKKNRLELLFLLCKTFDSFADFSKFEI
ncbi:MAG: glycine--tRNA ligase subunit beta [Candidatus Fonsibacter ubiquis]|nr:glycine--tRNA ligase subunit beta [Candidatus Fonsibacter ubiquis]